MAGRTNHFHRLARILFALALLAGGLAHAQPVSRHLALGNPSGAVADPAQPANYLISRDQYALSYHRDRGIPTWVAWHLEAADLGDTPRYSGQFITDTSLPTGWYRVTHGDYTNTGYDRGHMTPSADRTASSAANESTFILTNVLPQAPENNQGLWAQFEDFTRSLVAQGNEVYVLSGGAGSLNTLAGGNITVPAVVWKVVLALPAADGNDADRVTAQTQVIALWTPNDASVAGKPWQDFQVSVRCVEQRTGLDIFSAVEDTVEASIQGAPCDVAPAGNAVYLPLVSRGMVAPPPTPSPSPTPPPAQANVVIAAIEFDPPGDDVAGEFVLIRNSGTGTATLTGWTLRDAAETVFTFPAFTLAPGAEVRVWTKAGANDTTNLYWGRAQPIWNNSGDTAILRDSSGVEVSRFSYP